MPGTSRLTRRPVEIEAITDLADWHRMALASVVGDVDLATDNGRMFARIKGAVACAEVERKSARQRASNEKRAGARFRQREAARRGARAAAGGRPEDASGRGR